MIKRMMIAAVPALLLSACLAPMDQPQPGDPVGPTGAGQPATSVGHMQPGVIRTGPDDPLTPVGPPVDASAALATSASGLAQSTDGNNRSKPIVYYGNDRTIQMPETVPPVRFMGEAVSLNFEQAPLSEVTHAIMADILNLDYVVDRPIEGRVTLRTRTPIERNQLLNVLESLLRSNDVIMVRGADGRYLITNAKAAGEMSTTVSNPRNRAAGYSTIVVPLQYISAANMAEILKPVAEESSLVRVDTVRNLLMLAGTREQLDGWLEMVEIFDVDLLKGMSVGLYPLENGDVEEVAAALSSVVSDGDGDDEGASPLADLVRVVPVKRLNSIMVVTPRRQYLDTLGTWIERMDAATDARFEKRLHVYPVQNTSASRLAELLNRIYVGSGAGEAFAGTGAGSQGSAAASRNRGIAPGLVPETIGSSSGSQNLSLPASTGSDAPIASLDLMPAGDDTSILADVRVVADDDNNALMIYATGRQYEIIRSAVEQLDVVATQVIIEASILEVTLTDELKYGLEWEFRIGLGGGYDSTGLLAATANAPGAQLPGFSYSITDSSGDIRAVLNALSEESLINVISTPSVMVLDNHTAYIHVGDQVPIIDQQSTSDASDTSRITQSITYKDTGVKLSVTPSVNAGGLVTMDVQQSVTDVGLIDAATGQRSFLERNIMSRVAVRSNQSVVLGGLIRENATNTDSGVPVLHKLPLVGPLFGTTEKEDRRTELLVIITPRALYSENELQQVSDEMRARVRHMELIDVPVE